MSAALLEVVRPSVSNSTVSRTVARSLVGLFVIVILPSFVPAAESDSEPPLSAASKRALRYTKGPEWFCEFRTQPITGDLAYEQASIDAIRPP